jgi:hypothetical protein
MPTISQTDSCREGGVMEGEGYTSNKKFVGRNTRELTLNCD